MLAKPFLNPDAIILITYSSSILMYESFIRTNLDRIVSARQALPSYDPAHAHEKERAG